MAIIRIPRAAVPTGADGGPDLTAILQRLAPAGALAKGLGKLTDSSALGNAGTGFGGLLGLTRGIVQDDPGQAIGGAANVGSGLAGLLDYPGVGSALGAAGGPLTLATGLAKGDPLSSTIGGLQTASMASGALGGPTISSSVSGLAGLLPEWGAGAAAGSASELGLGAGAAAAGETGLLAGLAPFAAAAAPALLAIFGALGGFEGSKASQMKQQLDEYKDYTADFPGLATRRATGAKLFDTLGDDRDPAALEAALRTAASGAHANVEPAAWNVSHAPTLLPKLKPMDLTSWDAAAPALGGHNAGAFLGLMDQGQAAGLDVGGMTGDWNLNPAEFATVGEGRKDVTVPVDDTNRTGEDYRTKLGYNNTAQFDDAGVQTWGDPGQTQEAQDLGNAVAGMGAHLGIDWNRVDPANPDAGYADYQNFNPEQLAGYGFTPGHYGAASLNYLRSFDPSVTERPEWADYTKALDPTNTLADLDPLTLTPRKRVTTPAPWAPYDLGSAE